MKFSYKHIFPFFNISILLIGFILYSSNPMNALAIDNSLSSYLQLNSESFSYSEFTTNDELPDDEESDFEYSSYEISLKETENEESSTGKSSLAILKQHVSHVISYIEIPPSDVLTLFNHQKILPNKNSSLLETGFLFSQIFNFSPQTSGIAINAP